MGEFTIDVSHLRPVHTARLKLGVQINPHSAPTLTLIGKHAGRGNTAFLNAVMKIEGEYSTALTAQHLDDGDEKRAELFARTVITDWEGPCDNDGKPVPYSPEKLMMVFSALIAAKRPDVVAAAFRFFADADNFTAAAALGKE